MRNRHAIIAFIFVACEPGATTTPAAGATEPATDPAATELAPAPKSPWNSETPMEIGMAPASATPIQRQALYWVNTYRTLAGIPPVTERETLNDSAAWHAKFMSENPSLYEGGLGPHEQAPTGIGFSGVYFWERMDRAGYSGEPFGEVIAYQARPASAIAHWMETPYHRLPLLHPSACDVGYAEYGSGTEFVNVLDVGRARDADPALVSGAPAGGVAWPPDGADEVPLSWDGAESPAPPAPPAGFPSGPVLSLQFGLGAMVTATHTAVADEFGALVPHVVLTASSDANLKGEPAVVLYPHRPLAPGARYEVTISGTVDGAPYTRTWTFQTRASSTCDLVGQDCGVGQGCFVTKESTVCAWDGAMADGEACQFQNDCRGGLTCAAKVCRQFCRLGVTGDESCTARCVAGASPLAVTGVGVCRSPTK